MVGTNLVRDRGRGRDGAETEVARDREAARITEDLTKSVAHLMGVVMDVHVHVQEGAGTIVAVVVRVTVVKMNRRRFLHLRTAEVEVNLALDILAES